jgi:hypothetical protein
MLITKVISRENTIRCLSLHRIYYDLSMDFGSEDPSNPAVTTRVLTIGHVSDY